MPDPAQQRARRERQERNAARLRERRVARSVDALRGALVPVSYYAAPNKPGAYALWLAAQGWADLNLGECPKPEGAWLHVGSTADGLASSALRHHLTEGDTRNSSVRRTLVALTQVLFEWEVIPPDPARPSTYSRFVIVERDGSR